jgi:hypothetical protein
MFACGDARLQARFASRLAPKIKTCPEVFDLKRSIKSKPNHFLIKFDLMRIIYGIPEVFRPHLTS